MCEGFFHVGGETLAKKKKIYLVETAPGQIREFTDWPACQAFVSGKPFAFAGGVNREEAMRKLTGSKQKRAFSQKGRESKAPAKQKAPNAANRPTGGLTSDAGTHGNPGPCEFQVTDIHGNCLLHKELGVHTNNYAELAGIGGMIKIAIERGETELWTDSTIAMGWIRTGKLGPDVHEREALMKMIRKIQQLLQANPQLRLLKWDTRAWGQIPSDFGRK